MATMLSEADCLVTSTITEDQNTHEFVRYADGDPNLCGDDTSKFQHLTQRETRALQFLTLPKVCWSGNPDLDKLLHLIRFGRAELAEAIALIVILDSMREQGYTTITLKD